MRRLLLAFLLFLVFLLVGVPALVVRERPLPQLPEVPLQVDVPVNIFIPATGETRQLPLQEYLVGVLAAEMPASFPLPALEAQAVAARTYVVRRMRIFGGEGCSLATTADVCAGPESGQAWWSEEEMKQRWGFFGYLGQRRRIQSAVANTRGLIVVYQGRPIDAVYHSASGGRTEAAEDYWGKAEPYLRSVPSPFEEDSPYQEVKQILPYDEVVRRLGGEDEEIVRKMRAAGPSARILERTPSGRNAQVEIGSVVFSGREVREKLGLRSTWFEVTVDRDRLVFVTRGNGHGVGLSQYGAAGLARRGYDFRQILRHYYPGTELREIFAE